MLEWRPGDSVEARFVRLCVCDIVVPLSRSVGQLRRDLYVGETSHQEFEGSAALSLNLRRGREDA